MNSDSGVNRQPTAVVLMLVSVLVYSLLPLLVDVFGDWGSVALVTGMWTLSYACVNGCVARWLSRRDGTGVSFRQLIREIPWWAYMVAFVAAFQWVFFAWSARLTETAVTTMIFECWPVLFLLGRKKFAPGADKQPVTAGDVTFVVVAAVGLLLVVFSNTSDSNASVSLWGPVVAGVALVIAAGAPIVNIKTSEEVAGMLSSHSRGGDARLKTCVSALQDAVARGAASVPLLIVGAAQAGSVDNVPVSALAVGFGIGVVHGITRVFFLGANHLSRSDLINSIYYGVPVLGLMWLWALTDVTIAEPSMFFVGVTGVVAVNIAIHLDPEGTGRSKGHKDLRVSGHGFKALIVALWVSGAVVLLKDELLPASMLGWAVPEYWGLVTLGATVFVLILSFRQSRLADRTREAERMMLSTYSEVQTCRDHGLLDVDTEETLLGYLRALDTGRGAKDIGLAYLNFRKTIIHEALSNVEKAAGRERLRGLLRDVEILTNLRQGGRNIDELMVMVLFAALTIFVALFIRPKMPGGEPGPWIGFTVELFCLALASAVGFMAFDLLDRSLERDRSLLREVAESAIKKHKQAPGWRLNLRSYVDVTAQRVLAGILCSFVFAMFVALLWHKWFL